MGSKGDNQQDLPSSRLARLGKMGSLASRVAGNMLAEGASQLAKGKRPQVKDLLLTPNNLLKVADQLAQLRGAAMKVGQLLSMDAGDLIPPELNHILSRLRADAQPMPDAQLAALLTKHWGEDWRSHFISFDTKPIAAASIGQVHKAVSTDLQRMAIKIQYPGIAQSIDSDVDNVATLLKISGLLPKSFDLKPLLKEAKQQLHDEANYQLEGQRLEQFNNYLNDDPAFLLPRVIWSYSNNDVLAMSFVDGIAIEQLTDTRFSQAIRDQVMSELFRLFFKELFEFKLVQTDPNFANYQYNPESGQIVLLDFGATREYEEHFVTHYQQLMNAAIINDQKSLEQAALNIGLMQANLPDALRDTVLTICYMACESLYLPTPYDFAKSDLPIRLRDLGIALGSEKAFRHSPPAPAIFLHRKLGGLFLLAARLSAKVDMQALFAPYRLD